MRSDRLCLSSPLKHEELRQDRDRLQKYREGPEDLLEGEFVVEDEGEDEGRSEKVFDAEGVNGGVVRWSTPIKDRNQRGCRWKYGEGDKRTGT